ncbi:MAG: rhodanese-like domain-containing protein [Minisyncoccia bacterium]
MNPQQIQKLVDSGEVVLIDVREKDEWDAGHIEGAMHIPLGSLNAETVKDLSKDSKIYAYCRSGGRAGRAAQTLQNIGYKNAENMGGVIEWQENGGKLV